MSAMDWQQKYSDLNRRLTAEISARQELENENRRLKCSLKELIAMLSHIPSDSTEPTACSQSPQKVDNISVSSAEQLGCTKGNKIEDNNWTKKETTVRTGYFKPRGLENKIQNLLYEENRRFKNTIQRLEKELKKLKELLVNERDDIDQRIRAHSGRLDNWSNGTDLCLNSMADIDFGNKMTVHFRGEPVIGNHRLSYTLRKNTRVDRIGNDLMDHLKPGYDLKNVWVFHAFYMELTSGVLFYGYGKFGKYIKDMQLRGFRFGPHIHLTVVPFDTAPQAGRLFQARIVGEFPPDERVDYRPRDKYYRRNPNSCNDN